jgi:hypothetical protein
MDVLSQASEVRLDFASMSFDLLPWARAVKPEDYEGIRLYRGQQSTMTHETHLGA